MLGTGGLRCEGPLLVEVSWTRAMDAKVNRSLERETPSEIETYEFEEPLSSWCSDSSSRNLEDPALALRHTPLCDARICHL